MASVLSAPASMATARTLSASLGSKPAPSSEDLPQPLGPMTTPTCAADVSPIRASADVEGLASPHAWKYFEADCIDLHDSQNIRSSVTSLCLSPGT